MTAFEKNDADFEKLREWINEQASDYATLRRGIIEGCHDLKSRIAKEDDSIQFRDFIKTEDHEISTTDLQNYLDTLALFLPIKEPDQKISLNMQYRLLIRTLAHEWEENIDAQSLKQKHAGDLSKIHDIYTFAWIMKMTRNWVSHANLLEPLKPQFIAFLFLINMRAMFKSSKAIQAYEAILLSCISKAPVETIDLETLGDNIKYATQDIEDILSSLNISESNLFGNKISRLYRQNTGNPDAEEHDFKRLLLQYFWVNQKNYSRKLITDSDDFLPCLARHIYKHSFS